MKYCYMSPLFSLGILFLSGNSGCDSSSVYLEPEDLIANWQYSGEFSPNGERIAFEGLYAEIFAIHFVDKDGSYQGFILDDYGLVTSPSWGSDSNLVVSIDGNIFIIDLQTGSLRQLTNEFQDFHCTWSKDGKYISWTKTICDPSCGIMVYDLEKDSIIYNPGYGSRSWWNYDSRMIYYYHLYYEKRPNSHISDYKGVVFKRFSMDSLCTDSLYYLNTEKYYLWPSNFDVSPDEKEILFSAAEGSPAQIYIWKINLQNKSIYKMTIGDNPSYSPDGTRIIYTNTIKSEGGLWIMNSDGSNRRKFTELSK